ncbi:MAG: porin family protein [Oleispira antarctica]|nr:porin family protein [Oleispira antarctica]MBQ0793125.1 porin family protein [Oleispira antarctica]
MFKRISTIATVGLLSLTSVAAFAEPRGYIGAGYGQYKFKFEDDSNNQEFNDENTVGKVFLGAQATDVVGAEVTYLSFSDGEDGFIKSEIEGVSAALTLGLPLGDYFAIRARGGWLMWEANYKVSNLPIRKDVEGGDFFAGVGLEVGLGESVDIRIDYDRYQLDEDINPELDMMSVSAQFSF